MWKGITVVNSLLLVVIVLLAHNSATAATTVPTIYVSTYGNDSWSGSTRGYEGKGADGVIQGPKLTLDAALRLARNTYGPDVLKQISLAPGIYATSSYIGIYALDSNIIISSQDPGVGKTIVSGGVYIPRSANKAMPASPTGLAARIPAAVRSKVKQVDLFGLGLNASSLGLAHNNSGVELFFKGGAAELARWPNAPNYVLTGNGTNDKLHVSYQNATSWSSYADVYLHGFFGWDWKDERRQIASVDPATKVINLTLPLDYASLPNNRFYYYNVIDELDSPGEYYIDRTKGILYFYNPSTLASDSDAVLSVSPYVFYSRSSDNVTYRGLTVEATQGVAFSVLHSKNNVVHNCTIRNVGTNGVVFDQGFNNTLVASEVYNTGWTAVYLGGGNRTLLTPITTNTSANHIAIANHIHHFGRVTWSYKPGFSLNGVGHRVINNEIHSGPHAGITFGSSNNIEVYFNEIYDVVQQAGDMGAIYQGIDWTGQGSYISYNYIHDVGGKWMTDVCAIYLDEVFSGTTIFGNIVVNVPRGVLIGGGRDNLIKNNIFVNISDTTQMSDARGLEADRYKSSNNATLYSLLEQMPIDSSPVWIKQFPSLSKIWEDPVGPYAPRNNEWTNNVACRAANEIRTIKLGAKWFPNVTHDNWWSNASNCQHQIFTNPNAGVLQVKTAATFKDKLPFFATIPWTRMGRAGAVVTRPIDLIGLKYGGVVTPVNVLSMMSDDQQKEHSAAASLSTSMLAGVVQWLHL